MDWQERIRAKGLRISEPRRQIMALLAETTVPLSPAAIHASIQKQGGSLSLASVYRTLDLLEDLGLLCQVYLADGNLGFMVHESGHHHHILCRCCNRSVDFPGSDDLLALAARVEEQTGYTISDHILQFYGLCPQCRQA